MHRRLFLLLSTGFFLAVIIGTITHEAGHYFTARALGYKAGINYAYSWWEDTEPNHPVNRTHEFLITCAGPLETMLAGTIGLLLLLCVRRSFRNTPALSFRQWLLIFVTLFWLRPAVNFAVWLGGGWMKGKFSGSSDEVRIAAYLQGPAGSVSLLTAMIGVTVLGIVLLKFIPHQQRRTFLLAGLFGGIAGYVLWLYVLGPVVWP